MVYETFIFAWGAGLSTMTKAQKAKTTLQMPSQTVMMNT